MNKIDCCGECKHWDGEEVPHDDKYGSCKILEMKDCTNRYQENDLAHVVDASGFYAGLRCKFEFGCRLFERMKEGCDG